uniref:Uncharacterized protein n=1 Tax=Lepeophtheirus salmonis TaxID=72036 RepID=A0A0K2UK77_LEPSM
MPCLRFIRIFSNFRFSQLNLLFSLKFVPVTFFGFFCSSIECFYYKNIIFYLVKTPNSCEDSFKIRPNFF